jgi:hypothetical protein
MQLGLIGSPVAEQVSKQFSTGALNGLKVRGAERGEQKLVPK